MTAVTLEKPNSIVINIRPRKKKKGVKGYSLTAYGESTEAVFELVRNALQGAQQPAQAAQTQPTDSKPA